METTMEDLDLHRNCTALEREWLTGTRDAAGQRAWCDRMGVRYTKRARVDECEVWLDGKVCALLGGWRDPNVGAGLASRLDKPSCWGWCLVYVALQHAHQQRQLTMDARIGELNGGIFYAYLNGPQNPPMRGTLAQVTKALAALDAPKDKLYVVKARRQVAYG